MLGYRFIKTQPTDYVIQVRNGRPRREGLGLSFWYFAPTSSLVVVPTASVNEPFIFEEVTVDFQEITLQGQVTYRIAQPRRTSAMLNFALDPRGRYVSEDPQRLSQRLLVRVQVAARAEIQALTLKQALVSDDRIVTAVREKLRTDETLDALGLEVLGLSILAIKPKPETARALEAEAREALLRGADEAIYARRRAAVEQEQVIKETELNTEIAVETKKRQIRETQMDAERAVQERARQIEQEGMTGRIQVEQMRRDLVGLAGQNTREEADAQAYALGAAMRALAGVDPRTVQALAGMGMDSRQLMALAFRDLADNAERIGQLNIAPDLLREIMDSGSGRGGSATESALPEDAPASGQGPWAGPPRDRRR